MQFLLCIDLVRPVLLDHLGLGKCHILRPRNLAEQIHHRLLGRSNLTGQCNDFLRRRAAQWECSFRLPRSSRAAR